MENQDNIDINKPEPLQKKKLSKKEKRHTDFPGNPVKGRGLYKWSKFFFVLTILGTVLTGFVLVLPALLAYVCGNLITACLFPGSFLGVISFFNPSQPLNIF